MTICQEEKICPNLNFFGRTISRPGRSQGFLKETTSFSIKLPNDFVLTFDELPELIWKGKLLEVIRADSL